uniref:Uncharacterized protein n=1 Tax=Rhizophora mucronata TaxID=61149 RepID=A0A2P2R1S9_RHIMU
MSNICNKEPQKDS